MNGYHLFSMTERTAAKRHQCIWCGEFIPTGSKYQDERSVYDGQHQHHRWHVECLQDARDGWARGDDTEFSPYSAERPEAISPFPAA